MRWNGDEGRQKGRIQFYGTLEFEFEIAIYFTIDPLINQRYCVKGATVVREHYSFLVFMLGEKDKGRCCWEWCPYLYINCATDRSGTVLYSAAEDS